MSDISFLPSSLREKEEEIKKESLHAAPKEPVSMHVPETEEEDVEIIEVDASEVDQMLIGEPLYTRLYYKASLLFASLKEKYLEPRPAEAPPKSPPQFFKPSAAKPESAIKKPVAPAVSMPADQKTKESTDKKSAVETPKPKARIRPASTKPQSGRRVRIIKRVRKPVHVSLLDEQTMRDLHINIPKRKFTLVFLSILFAVIFGSAYLLLDQATAQAVSEQKLIQNRYNEVKSSITSEQDKWQAFQDLEPRLIALNDLLETHISANNVLKFLEENTLKDISYASFMMSSDGRINMSVTAASYDAAARQLMIFEESPMVKAAEANSFNVAEKDGQNYVSFQLVLYLQPHALLFKQTEIETASN